MCRVYSVNVREKGVCTFSGIDVDVGNNIVKKIGLAKAAFLVVVVVAVESSHCIQTGGACKGISSLCEEH